MKVEKAIFLASGLGTRLRKVVERLKGMGVLLQILPLNPMAFRPEELMRDKE